MSGRDGDWRGRFHPDGDSCAERDSRKHTPRFRGRFRRAIGVLGFLSAGVFAV